MAGLSKATCSRPNWASTLEFSFRHSSLISESRLFNGKRPSVREHSVSTRQAREVRGVQIQPWGVSDRPTGVKIPPPALFVPPPVSKVDFLSQPQRSLLRSSRLNFRVVVAVYFPDRQSKYPITVRPIFTEAAIACGGVELSKPGLDRRKVESTKGVDSGRRT